MRIVMLVHGMFLTLGVTGLWHDGSTGTRQCDVPTVWGLPDEHRAERPGPGRRRRAERPVRSGRAGQRTADGKNAAVFVNEFMHDL